MSTENNSQIDTTVPFTEILEATDKSAGVPDGTYLLQLTRVERYEGLKYNTTDVPQDKLRFVLTVMSGPEQGVEVWDIENLPPLRDGKRTVSKKSGSSSSTRAGSIPRRYSRYRSKAS